MAWELSVKLEMGFWAKSDGVLELLWQLRVCREWLSNDI